MHTALYVTGFGALIFAALTYFAAKAADRPGDDFGAVVPAILAGGATIILTLTWLVLVIYKAASA